MQRLVGLGVSGGIAIGRAVVIETRSVDVYRFPIQEADVDAEVARFTQALGEAREEVELVRERTHQDLGSELAGVFEAHLLMLADGGFTERVERRIREERVNAEWALHRTVEEYAERFAAIHDQSFRERAADLQDVALHLLRRLQGISHHDLSEISGPVVIVADDLTPSEAIRLGRERVVGFAIETGGRTSHTTIIARSLKIPAVAGLGEVTSFVTDEDPVIIDGEQGVVILHPTPEEIARHEAGIETLECRERDLLAAGRDLPAETRDGVDLTLMANIDLPEELADAAHYGADGIGLYRSEFLYIEKSPRLPTEEEHLDLYRQVIEAAAPHPAIVRTYDLGGRKLAREILDSREENPVLGLRGIRLTLARPQVFKTQLRALFRAGVYGDLWVMVPLVSSVDEVRGFRAFTRAVVEELEDEGLPHRSDIKIGVMIEVPSAALTADLLAREVDFFSIGTNDLIQYSLAVDRNNEQVADLYQPLHPAILRMLAFVIESADKAGIEVGLCGEVAADERYAALLVGLGLRRFSAAPRLLPAIKRRLGQHTVSELRELAHELLQLETATEIEERLSQALLRGKSAARSS